LTTDTLHFSPTLFDSAEREALTATPGFHSLFVVEGDGGDAIGRRWLHLTPTACDNVMGQIAELRAEWLRGTPDGTLLTRALVLRLLIHLSRFFATTATGKLTTASVPGWHDTTVAAAVRYMETHYAEPLRIDQIAAMVYLSPDRFTEVFASTMGRTPRDYLRHLRLERARTLLRTTDNTVEEIARLSGFGNAAYLARVLKTSLGQTPRMVRKQEP
jgi:AraC-like DNA-binding protein